MTKILLPGAACAIEETEGTADKRMEKMEEFICSMKEPYTDRPVKPAA